MAKKPETVFLERIRPKLRQLANTWFVKIQQRTIRGTPDLIMCVNGQFVALEFKKSVKEQADMLQAHTIEMINLAGGIALVVSPENWEKVLEALTTLSKGNYLDRTKIGTT